MEEDYYYYCPICYHGFVQGESNYNDETGDTDYHCPVCEYDFSQDEVIDSGIIINKLVEEIDNKDIELKKDIELRLEDAKNVVKELQTHDFDEAIKLVVCRKFEELLKKQRQ